MGKHEVANIKPERLSFIIFSLLFSLTIISGLIISSIRTNADTPTTASTSASTSVFVTAACTLSGGNHHYTDTIMNGSAKVYGPSTIKTVCNDASGYALYAVGYSGDTIGSGNNDKMLATSTGSSNNIVTATDDNPGSSSYWAMKVTAVSGTYAPTIENSFDRTAYHTVPTTMTKVASLSSATDQGESATGSSINANYKVSISSSQPADTYTGKVKYTLVHPNSFVIGTYDINYLANGGTGTMTSQTNLANYEDQTLSSIAGPTSTITPPANYRFIGWCTAEEGTPATSTNPQTTCPGQFYTDAATIPASTVNVSSSSVTANYNLYAVYNLITSTITLNQNGATTSSSPTSLTATYSKSTLSPATITNPEKAYSVSGFTMGTDASGANVTFPSTGNCTSASSCTYSHTFSGWYNTSSSTGGTEIITSSGALTPSNGYTDSNGNWTSTSDQTVYARWTASTDPSNTITLPTITKTGYTCGWSENSTASTYTYESGYSGLTLDNDITLYGICVIKSNLSLQVSFDSGVESITVREGSATGTIKGIVTTSGTSVTGLLYNMQYFLIPTYASGYELDAWSQDAGTVGTLSSTTDANPFYRVGDGSNGVTLASKSSCSSTFPTGTYMQNFNPSTLCSNVISGTLKDSRDQQNYTVAKLADGKWWMTKNLNLAGGTTISCDTSDCENYTIPTDKGWQSGSRLPVSSTSGFDVEADTNHAYVYNSNNTTCSNNNPCYSYYSWDVATLGSARNSSTENTNAPYSVCPKNWKLPSTYNGSGAAAATTNFRALMIAYGGSDSIGVYNSSTNPTGATLYNKIGPNTTPNFQLSGGFLYDEEREYTSFTGSGSIGVYWSSTDNGYYNFEAKTILVRSSYISSIYSHFREEGLAIRCVK